VLVSTSAILSVAEKERLRVAYGAAAVDMEAATVARLARAHGLKFQAIKVISDGADFNMGGLAGFATEDGQFREGAFALHAAVRPWMWGRLMSLARNSSKAVKALNEAVRAELDL
jgi:adenosylhomocysteine nucleosidase